MKASVFFVSAAFAAVSCPAGELTLEELAPHFSTNTQIIWKAPTNALPKSLWVYKKLPNTFTAPVISNAVVMASFQSKGIPQPSTNRVVLWDSAQEGDPFAGSFATLPDAGIIQFMMRNHASGSSKDIPSDETIAKRAWDSVAKLGLDHAQLSQGRLQNNPCEYNEKGGLAADGTVGGRTITLVRKIDGVDFQEESEGFSIEFGSHGTIRSFTLSWPNLKRDQNNPTITPEQIIRCIRAHRTLVLPNNNENQYFARIKSLTNAQKLTIVKITPRYGEGVFGEAPKEDQEPSKIVSPYVELEAVADFGATNMSLRLLCPITMSDVARLLKSK